MTRWWRDYAIRRDDRALEGLSRPDGRSDLARWLDDEEGTAHRPAAPPELLWLIRVLSVITSTVARFQPEKGWAP